jgi:hypothetical protein
MLPNNSFTEFINKKEVRFALAALCAFFTVTSAIELLGGTTRVNYLHGGGGVMIWGGWAVVNALHPFQKKVPGINALINIGLVLFVASWLMR